MFLRTTKRRYNGKTFTSHVLVESVRTPKGPRQRTVCSLGDLAPRRRGQWLALAHRVEHALAGQGELLERDPAVPGILAKVEARRRRRPPAIAVDPARVGTERHREAGPAHVGYRFWRRLGLDGILAELGLDERTRKLTCAMTLNRLIAPASEHAMPAWFRTAAVADLLGADLETVGEDALYANMDRLHPHRAAIETALVARERSLFNLDPTVYLYDLTSTYFEGLAEDNPKARRGHSRDHRPDCKQVLIALALGREGFPVAHEVLAGNTQDRASLAAMLDRLAARVGLKRGDTVVVDRGMAYDDNLAELGARGLHYILASRQPERDRWLAEYAHAEDFVEVLRPTSPNNPHQSKTPVKLKSLRQGATTFVLCHSQGRVEKDRAIRHKQEQRLHGDLDRLGARLAKGRIKRPVKIGEAIGRIKERYPRVARYWRIEYLTETGRLVVETDEPARSAAEALDGCYLLKTDRADLDAEEAWRTYMLLTRVEAAFRALKSPLGERPVFHQVERRVDTHIFLCVLAYHLLTAIEKTLVERGLNTSWPTVRDRLRSHQICTVVLPTTSGAVLRIRQAATPEPEQREIYRLLDLPEQIIAPRRSWHEP